jgi:tetratricopeptide (TPR) repeat protein
MRFNGAEKLLTGALESMEKSDTQSTQIPNYLRGLTSAYRAEGKLAEALAAAQRALEIDRSSGGGSANSLVTADFSIAGILQAQGKNEAAERAVNQATELAGPNPNPAIEAVLLLIFGSIYKSEGRLLEAEVPLQKALKICSPRNTQASPAGSCAAVQEILSDVYRKEGKAFDADQMTSTKLDNATSNLNNLDRRAQQYMDDRYYGNPKPHTVKS